MKMKIAFVLILLLAICTSFAKDFNISHIRVYNKFLRNGYTANICNAFSSPKENNIDTSTGAIVITPKDLNDALKAASVKRHFQRKFGGITLGGEFIENNRMHYFVYFEESDLLIDFTDNKEYKLKSKIIVH